MYWMNEKNEPAQPELSGPLYEHVVNGLKRIYETKIKPVETTYKFHEFYSPPLTTSDFEAKPLVLFVGQYSTGKTTFIKSLLERDFPGQHIGPEPTTDRFIVVLHGRDERVIPGNTLTVQADLPFRALNKFGSGLLNKLQAAQLPVPILEDLMFVDTPGILSGEKQSLGRSYDFTSVCKWFAERADLILVLFDAHKLDISDELKAVILALKPYEDKMRIVLNKVDTINPQQLLRVYGALMWSLGKVVQTPEVMRVFLSSSWDKEQIAQENQLKDTDFRKLLEAERNDLLRELRTLSRNSSMRKVNELVRRGREVKVHAYLLSHLKAQMPVLFWKDTKQAELIASLEEEVRKVQIRHQLPPGDLPNLKHLKTLLSSFSFDTFPKLNPKLMQVLDEVFTEDIPALLKAFDAPPTKLKSQTNQMVDDQNFNFPQMQSQMFPQMQSMQSQMFSQMQQMQPQGQSQMFPQMGIPIMSPQQTMGPYLNSNPNSSALSNQQMTNQQMANQQMMNQQMMNQQMMNQQMMNQQVANQQMMNQQMMNQQMMNQQIDMFMSPQGISKQAGQGTPVPPIRNSTTLTSAPRGTMQGGIPSNNNTNNLSAQPGNNLFLDDPQFNESLF